MTMAKVSFIPLGKVREITPGATILAAANQSRVPVGQSCGGVGICGWCRVSVLRGLDQLEPPSPAEQRLLSERDFRPDERLSCLARIKGDVTVTTGYW
jgi:ferredoxin